MLDKVKFLTALDNTAKQFASTSKQYGELSLKDAGKSEFLTVMISDINKGAFDLVKVENEEVNIVVKDTVPENA